jgi:Flp pilus assembly protein TadB
MSQIVPKLLFLSIVIATFSFIAVAVWSRERRREREAYYRGETLRKIAETQGTVGNSAIEFLREDEKYAARRRGEGQKLGGLITVACGRGLWLR